MNIENYKYFLFCSFVTYVTFISLIYAQEPKQYSPSADKLKENSLRQNGAYESRKEYLSTELEGESKVSETIMSELFFGVKDCTPKDRLDQKKKEKIEKLKMGCSLDLLPTIEINAFGLDPDKVKNPGYEQCRAKISQISLANQVVMDDMLKNYMDQAAFISKNIEKSHRNDTNASLQIPGIDFSSKKSDREIAEEIVQNMLYEKDKGDAQGGRSRTNSLFLGFQTDSATEYYTERILAILKQKSPVRDTNGEQVKEVSLREKLAERSRNGIFEADPSIARAIDIKNESQKFLLALSEHESNVLDESLAVYTDIGFDDRGTTVDFSKLGASQKAFDEVASRTETQIEKHASDIYRYQNDDDSNDKEYGNNKLNLMKNQMKTLNQLCQNQFKLAQAKKKIERPIGKYRLNLLIKKYPKLATKNLVTFQTSSHSDYIPVAVKVNLAGGINPGTPSSSRDEPQMKEDSKEKINKFQSDIRSLELSKEMKRIHKELQLARFEVGDDNLLEGIEGERIEAFSKMKDVKRAMTKIGRKAAIIKYNNLRAAYEKLFDIYQKTTGEDSHFSVEKSIANKLAMNQKKTEVAMSQLMSHPYAKFFVSDKFRAFTHSGKGEENPSLFMDISKCSKARNEKELASQLFTPDKLSGKGSYNSLDVIKDIENHILLGLRDASQRNTYYSLHKPFKDGSQNIGRSEKACIEGAKQGWFGPSDIDENLNKLFVSHPKSFKRAIVDPSYIGAQVWDPDRGRFQYIYHDLRLNPHYHGGMLCHTLKTVGDKEVAQNRIKNIAMGTALVTGVAMAIPTGGLSAAAATAVTTSLVVVDVGASVLELATEYHSWQRHKSNHFQSSATADAITHENYNNQELYDFQSKTLNDTSKVGLAIATLTAPLWILDIKDIAKLAKEAKKAKVLAKQAKDRKVVTDVNLSSKASELSPQVGSENSRIAVAKDAETVDVNGVAFPSSPSISELSEKSFKLSVDDLAVAERKFRKFEIDNYGLGSKEAATSFKKRLGYKNNNQKGILLGQSGDGQTMGIEKIAQDYRMSNLEDLGVSFEDYSFISLLEGSRGENLSKYKEYGKYLKARLSKIDETGGGVDEVEEITEELFAIRRMFNRPIQNNMDVLDLVVSPFIKLKNGEPVTKQSLKYDTKTGDVIFLYSSGSLNGKASQKRYPTTAKLNNKLDERIEGIARAAEANSGKGIPSNIVNKQLEVKYDLNTLADESRGFLEDLEYRGKVNGNVLELRKYNDDGTEVLVELKRSCLNMLKNSSDSKVLDAISDLSIKRRMNQKSELIGDTCHVGWAAIQSCKRK